MPMGSRHSVTGLLLMDRGRPVLEVDGGGTWRLEVARGAGRLLGRRVRVEGARVGFDVLDVSSLRPIGAPVPAAAPWWRRLLG